MPNDYWGARSDAKLFYEMPGAILCGTRGFSSHDCVLFLKEKKQVEAKMKNFKLD